MTDTKTGYIDIGPKATNGPVNWDRAEAFYEAANALFDYDLGWVPTRPEVQQLLAWVKDRRPDQAEGSGSIKRLFREHHVFYPYIDETAVRKAADFHWDVWPTLTTRERVAVIDRLAAHPDPWEEDGFHVAPANKAGSKPGGTVYVPVTKRAQRWVQMPHRQRKGIMSTVFTRIRRGQA